MVATRCRTGKPEFLSKDTGKRSPCWRQGRQYPDFVQDGKAGWKKLSGWRYFLPIAYQRAFWTLGYEKVVVILTREQGYRKKPVDRFHQYAQKRYFAPLPKLGKHWQRCRSVTTGCRKKWISWKQMERFSSFVRNIQWKYPEWSRISGTGGIV